MFVFTLTSTVSLRIRFFYEIVDTLASIFLTFVPNAMF
jgi:hypothetical protein